MKRRNVTRNALFTSIISLLLCVSMLVGTTFAWFTDEVTSAGNIIKSGTLDVELYWADGTKAVPTDAAGWTDASKGAIFNYTLWEPGYTEVRHIKIANEGTLALKYQLMIRANGEVSELADVIDVYFTDPAEQIADRTALVSATPVGTLSEVLATMPKSTSGTLLAGKEATVTLALKMQESAGNEYQDLAIGTNFSVVLVATQLEAENDSFDNTYDEDAWGEGFAVVTEQDLNAAIANGETAIDLMADITLTETLEIPAGTAVKLNLSGYELSGNKTKDSGAAIVNNGTLSIYGGEMSNNAVNGAAVIENNGILTLDGVTVKGAPMDSTGYPEYAVVTYGKLTVEEGTAIVADRGAIRTYAGAEVVINGGSFTVSNAADGRNMTFHTIYAYGNGAKLTINDGYFEQNHTSTGGASVICPAGASIDIYGGDFRDAMDDTNWTSTGNFQNYMGSTAPVNVYGGTFDDATVNKNLASGYKAVESNGKYIVVSENVDGVVTTAAGLADAIAQGGVVSVMADIDMNNAWTSVVPANGLVIEGNDHVISNLNLPLMAGKAGPTVTVKGLTIADSNVGIAANEKGLGTGAFIAFADYSGTLVFEDCHLVNSTVTGNERAAAFVGYSYADVTIKDCSVDKCTITAVGSTAALIGHANGVTTIEKTSVTNTKVTATEDRTGSTAVAGSLIGTVANTTALNNVTTSNNTVSNTGATPYSAEFGRIVSPGKLIVDGAEYLSKAADLVEALKNGKDVVLADDVKMESATTAPYGNKYGVALNGGTLDGNGNELYMECYGDDYGIMTTGGTIKNLTIKEGCRAVMIMYPTQDIILDNVNIGGDGVLYPINTGETGPNGPEGIDLIVTNSTIKGWTSYGDAIESASFTNVKFEQGTYYNNIYGRVLKPYVNTTLTNCSFIEHMNLDLSALVQGQKVTFVNCTVNGQSVTADVFTIPSTDEQYDTELFTVDLPSWASNISDCIVFG